MRVPDEGAGDFGNFESVGGVYCHEVFGLPMGGDSIDARAEVDGFHFFVLREGLGLGAKVMLLSGSRLALFYS